MQKSHPEIPVHPLLEQYEKLTTTATGHAREVNQELSGLSFIRKWVEDQLDDNERTRFEAAGCQFATEQLDALKLLWLNLFKSSQTATQNVEDGFAIGLSEIIDNIHNGQSIFIVTSGYSKVVRQLLTKGLSKARDLATKQASIYLYFITDQTNARVATQEMVVEVTSDPTSEIKAYKSYATGDLNQLLSTVSNNDKLIYLTGAECVDRDGRVVHPRGSTSVLDEIKAQHPSLIAWACIEEFKRLD